MQVPHVLHVRQYYCKARCAAILFLRHFLRKRNITCQIYHSVTCMFSFFWHSFLWFFRLDEHPLVSSIRSLPIPMKANMKVYFQGIYKFFSSLDFLWSSPMNSDPIYENDCLFRNDDSSRSEEDDHDVHQRFLDEQLDWITVDHDNLRQELQEQLARPKYVPSMAVIDQW